MRSIALMAAGLLAPVLLSGCSWVDVKPAAQKVRILEPQEVVRCREVGKVSSHTKDKIWFIARGKDTIKEEVDNLARNNAADLGADTIVPVGPTVDGEQHYNVYRCINP